MKRLVIAAALLAATSITAHAGPKPTFPKEFAASGAQSLTPTMMTATRISILSVSHLEAVTTMAVWLLTQPASPTAKKSDSAALFNTRCPRGTERSTQPISAA